MNDNRIANKGDSIRDIPGAIGGLTEGLGEWVEAEQQGFVLTVEGSRPGDFPILHHPHHLLDKQRNPRPSLDLSRMTYTGFSNIVIMDSQLSSYPHEVVSKPSH